MTKALTRQAKELKAPLPVKNGVAPSRVWLAPGSWEHIGQFLLERFPHVAKEDLLMRLERGDIVTSTGQAVRYQTPYQPQQWLWYYRHVDNEVSVPFDMPVLFANERIVVVDKPHFLASTPGGQYLQHTALTRVRQLFSDASITPIHRLDRETAGVLVFCRQAQFRGAYQRLFQEQRVEKTYEAIAATCSAYRFPLHYQSNIQPTKGQFLVQQQPGLPNSDTFIRILAHWHDIRHGAVSWYQLQPTTGRKHQLRVHLEALGVPIINDSYYPAGQKPLAADNFSTPLQLLARRLAFTDPITQDYMQFSSRLQLALLPASIALRYRS